jgi:hypothetical protein
MAKDYLLGKLDKESRDEDKKIQEILMGKTKTNFSLKDTCSTQRQTWAFNTVNTDSCFSNAPQLLESSRTSDWRSKGAAFLSLSLQES